MEAFVPLGPLDHARRERLEQARRLRLRLSLMARRPLLEAELLDRQLKVITALPAWKRLGTETRGMLEYLHQSRRALLLGHATRLAGLGRRVEGELAAIDSADPKLRHKR